MHPTAPLCPTACPTSPELPMVEPNQAEISNPRVGSSSPSSGMRKPRECGASSMPSFRPGRAVSGLGLCGSRTSPQGPGVGPVGVQLHHRVKQLTRGHGRLIETIEVAQVLSGRRDVPGVVVVVGDLVPGDHDAMAAANASADPGFGSATAVISISSAIEARPGR